MALNSTELWSQKGTTQEQNGWGDTRYFSVVGTTTELLDGKAVVNAPGVPAINQAHPNFRDLRVVNKSAGPGLAERIVSVRYQWMPNGGVPGQNSENVFAQPPKISWGFSQRTELTDQDIHGNLICNSAGDVFSNLPSRTLFSLTLRVTRWERKFDVYKTRNYVNKVNSKPMIAGDVRFDPRSVLCTFIGPVEEFSAGANAVHMGYEFEIRPTGGSALPKEVASRPFAYWTVDTGLRCYNGEKKTLGSPSDLYYDDDEKKQVSQDVLFNGNGRPIDPSSFVVYKSDKTTVAPQAPPTTIKRSIDPVVKPGAVFLGFDVYEEADLLQLKL